MSYTHSYIAINYDLNAPGKNYEPLIEAIKRASLSCWCRPSDSHFIIKTNHSVESLEKILRPKTDANDNLCIVPIDLTKISYYGKPEAVKWIKDQLQLISSPYRSLFR